MSLHIHDGHCQIECNKGDGGVYTVHIRGGEGTTFHNGEIVQKNAQKELKPFDRLVVGDILLMFRDPIREKGEPEKYKPVAVDVACEEYRDIVAKQVDKFVF